MLAKVPCQLGTDSKRQQSRQQIETWEPGGVGHSGAECSGAGCSGAGRSGAEWAQLSLIRSHHLHLVTRYITFPASAHTQTLEDHIPGSFIRHSMNIFVLLFPSPPFLWNTLHSHAQINSDPNGSSIPDRRPFRERIQYYCPCCFFKELYGFGLYRGCRSSCSLLWVTFAHRWCSRGSS